jgi:DNA-binding NarL/FixJ family response regulator
LTESTTPPTTQPTVRPRVLIADDHAPTRAAVRDALERGGFAICAEEADAAASVAMAREQRPDVALLDIHMPGDGIRAAAEIAAHVPETSIVMLTVSSADDDLFAALQAGASGYLLKDTDPSRLPLALRGVLEGEAALPRALVARVINEFRDGTPRRRLSLRGNRPARLTTREWEVLEALDEGLTTAEISDRLFISTVTVRSHVSSILRKLRVPNRASAVRVLHGR